MKNWTSQLRSVAAVGVCLLMASPALPYSVLSHEAVVDTLWASSFRPALLARFPDATEEEMQQAHAYAYGGCIIQDMGYYPFGSKFFSDLTHYVRSGEFVEALLRDASNLNEYAFALGALEHYAGDNLGHPLATNLSVPLAYPQLRRKFGRRVTYEDDPVAHLRIEFAFDVVQVAHQHYASADYHNFIGFEVSKDLLARAFLETYSLDINKVFSNLDLALGSYRWSVRSLIPTMTKAAWAANKNDIAHTGSGITKRQFLYNLKRSSYEKEWGREYQSPGAWARFLGFLIRVLPKVGPLKALAMPKLTRESQELFMRSFNATIRKGEDLMAGAEYIDFSLANQNFDTGEPLLPGKYFLADETYFTLIGLLFETHYAGISPGLRENILAYCKDPAALHLGKHQDPEKLEARLAELRNTAPALP